MVSLVNPLFSFGGQCLNAEDGCRDLQQLALPRRNLRRMYFVVRREPRRRLLLANGIERDTRLERRGMHPSVLRHGFRSSGYAGKNPLLPLSKNQPHL